MSMQTVFDSGLRDVLTSLEGVVDELILASDDIMTSFNLGRCAGYWITARWTSISRNRRRCCAEKEVTMISRSQDIPPAARGTFLIPQSKTMFASPSSNPPWADINAVGVIRGYDMSW
jgi:hypothetical protein